jgi:hypothetical protein
MTYLYNPSETHTALFNQGRTEIKPQNYVEVSPYVLETDQTVKQALSEKTILSFVKLKDIPKQTKSETEPIEVNKYEGLTEAQFKEILVNKDPTEKVTGVVTLLGQPEEKVKTEAVTTTIGAKTESEEIETKGKRGPGGKAKPLIEVSN